MIFFPFLSGPPRTSNPVLLLAYCILYAVFAYVFAGMMFHFLFDWHHRFGEWKWGFGVLGGLMLAPAVALTLLAVAMAREVRGGGASNG